MICVRKSINSGHSLLLCVVMNGRREEERSHSPSIGCGRRSTGIPCNRISFTTWLNRGTRCNPFEQRGVELGRLNRGDLGVKLCG